MFHRIEDSRNRSATSFLPRETMGNVSILNQPQRTAQAIIQKEEAKVFATSEQKVVR
jgi:hypothetical protein